MEGTGAKRRSSPWDSYSPDLSRCAVHLFESLGSANGGPPNSGTNDERKNSGYVAPGAPDETEITIARGWASDVVFAFAPCKMF